MVMPTFCRVSQIVSDGCLIRNKQAIACLHFSFSEKEDSCRSIGASPVQSRVRDCADQKGCHSPILDRMQHSMIIEAIA